LKQSFDQKPKVTLGRTDRGKPLKANGKKISHFSRTERGR
tara:strand:- start:3028 stop:3147 length:120 start_codon:yes stop_codon:yes gene_type:complete